MGDWTGQGQYLVVYFDMVMVAALMVVVLIMVMGLPVIGKAFMMKRPEWKEEGATGITGRAEEMPEDIMATIIMVGNISRKTFL
jgi:hypothetical protein